MTAPEQGAAGKANAQRNTLTIYGRIESFKRYKESIYTTVALPAPDPFSGVQHVSIRSRGQLGQRLDVIEILCAVHGYRSSFDQKDKQTGEVTKGEKVQMYLQAIEQQ